MVLECSGIGCCPEWVEALAYLGIGTIYALIGLFVGVLIYEYFQKNSKSYDKDDVNNFVIIGVIFWPLAILVIAGMLLGLYLTFPFRGATKDDLNRLEAKLTNTNPVNTVSTSKDTRKFKVGDIITGISSNPDNYKVLTDRSKCRVKSIDDKGSMKLILIDHIDFEKFKDKIGTEFTAPQRNFKKVR